ncbi:MAG: MFS transporter [Candidatus Colwellbacteria bacterium]|nr:MFS transporter [Candidatus Colwellbacteria bacterium]
METKISNAHEKRIFGLKKNVFFLGLVSLFNDFSNEMIQSVMPVFLGVVLGLPPIAIGVIEGVADAVASFLKVVSGWVSDKLRERKNLAIIGYAVSVTSRLFLALASLFSHVFALRVIDRVGKGIRDAPRDALLAESVSEHELARSFGYHRAMDALGGTLGPLAAFVLLPALYYNYQALFIVAFFVGLLSLLSFFFVQDKKPAEDAGAPKFDFGLLKKHKHFAFYLAAIFVFGLGTLPITLMLFYPVVIESAKGMSYLANIPLAYFAYSLTFVLTAIPLGKFADSVGKRVTIAVGFAMAIIAYLGLAYSTSFGAVLFFFVVFGIYSGATDGVERALAARLIDRKLLATGEGMLNAAVGVSSLLSGLIGGALWTFYGPAAAFVYGAILSSVGLCVFLIFAFKK